MEKQSSLSQLDKLTLLCSFCFWAITGIRNTDVFYHLPSGVTRTVLVLGFVSAFVNLVWLSSVLMRKRIKGSSGTFRIVLVFQLVTILVQIIYFVILFHHS